MFGIGNAIGAVVGGAMNAQAQRQTNRTNIMLAREANQFSAKEAATSRNFQERMSNTAHQRQVSDMKKAGLNPMLSATQGGSSTPPGAQGSAHMARTESTRMGDALAQGISTALDTKRLKKEIKAVDSQVDLNKAAELTNFTQQQLNNAAAVKANTEKNLTSLQHHQTQMQTGAIEAEAKARSWEADARKETAKLVRDQSKLDRQFVKFDGMVKRAANIGGAISNATSIGRRYKRTKK